MRPKACSRVAAKSISSGEGGSLPSNEWDGATAKFLAEKPAAALPLHAPYTSRPDLCLTFRHGGWKPQREKVRAVLDGMANISPRRLAAFCACGENAFVEEGFADAAPPATATAVMANAIKAAHPHYRCRSIKCHDRFCLPCSQERAMRIRHALEIHTRGMQELKLLTLTVQASTDDLKTIMDRITKQFRAMRNSALWRRAVKGGVATIETKVGSGSGKWHVHYHVVMQSRFMPQRELSDLWLKITGNSKIVDIRPVGSIRGGISYITKYITKAADRSIMDSPSHLAECIEAFTGRRLVSTFGNWNGLGLNERHEDAETSNVQVSTWTYFGPLDEIISRALAGDTASLRIVQAIAPAKFRDTG